MILGVRVTDIYDVAKIQIELDELTKENLLAAIEAKYDKIKEQIRGIGAGVVVVVKPDLTEYYGPEIARGTILYFGIPAGHRIDLELNN